MLNVIILLHNLIFVMYSICLYIGKESYDSLSTISAKFSHELEQLKINGYKDSNNTIWPVELFFSGDWKFLALVMGINAATSNYFCLYCDCHKNERYDMDKVWLNSKNTHGMYVILHKFFI